MTLLNASVYEHAHLVNLLPGGLLAVPLLSLLGVAEVPLLLTLRLLLLFGLGLLSVVRQVVVRPNEEKFALRLQAEREKQLLTTLLEATELQH